LADTPGDQSWDDRNATYTNTIFKFNTGNVNGTTSTKQQLLTIDLTSVAAGATVANITTSAVGNATNRGDGFILWRSAPSTPISGSSGSLQRLVGRRSGLFAFKAAYIVPKMLSPRF
jgi:Tfp pilus assembly major pilin PilA